MKFLIVKPSPLPILIHLRPKYYHRIMSSNVLSLLSSQLKIDNFIVSHILIFKFLERSLEDKSVWNDIQIHTYTNILSHTLFT